MDALPPAVVWTLYRCARTSDLSHWDPPSGPHLLIGGSYYVEGHHLGNGLWCARWSPDSTEGLPLDDLRAALGPWTIVQAEARFVD